MTETETRKLGGSQIEVSALGVGTWAWGDPTWGYGKGYDGTDVHRAYTASREVGLTLFDTAEIYGNGQSERILGQCVKDERDAVVIASKFAPLPYRLSAAELPKALDASLARLGVSKIDLYQIHWPYTLIKIESLMDVLALAHAAGKIGAIGVSNFTSDQMKRAQERLARYNLKLASNQVHFSLLHRKPEANGVLATCRQLDVALIAYSPLEQGLLTGKFVPGYAVTGPRRYSPKFWKRNLAKTQPLLDTMKTIAKAHDKTSSQVALRWLLQRDPLVIPIPGAKSAQQAQQNAGALGWSLSENEFENISRAAHSWLKK